MTLTEHEMLSKYKDWLVTYPFTVPDGMTFIIDTSKIEDSRPLSLRFGFDEGNALRVLSKVIRNIPNVDGGGTQYWTNNLNILSWRVYDGDDDQRARNVEFFNQLAIWINEQETNKHNKELSPLYPWFSNNGRCDSLRAIYNGENSFIRAREAGIMEYQVAMIHHYEIAY